jgi:hypothetical protein
MCIGKIRFLVLGKSDYDTSEESDCAQQKAPDRMVGGLSLRLSARR